MKNQMRKNFAKDEEAVSPVVGVILMVAITVILAAIIAAFVLGLGSPKSAPKASLKLLGANDTAICLEHQGGEPIDFDARVEYLIAGTQDTTVILAGGFGSDGVLSVGEIGYVTGLTGINVATPIVLTDNVTSQQIQSFAVAVDSGASAIPATGCS